MLKRAVKYLLEKTYRPLLLRYLADDRVYRYDGLTLSVRKGVFHPRFFFSTRMLLEFMKRREVEGRRLLELGAGSGLIALEMARRGAKVWASDINGNAVEGVRENAARNGLRLTALHSDLFDKMQGAIFDIIIINPPYYPRDPSTEGEHAWFCGSGFEYFRRLFEQLPAHIDPASEVYMILSEDCAIETIAGLAASAGLGMTEVYRKRAWWEMNYIFSLARA